MGKWKPVVLSTMGLLEIGAAAPEHTIQGTITKMTPNTGINLLGGDWIFVEGTYLPYDKETLEESVIEFFLDDPGKTPLIPGRATPAGIFF
jgi:hypothetical protein